MTPWETAIRATARLAERLDRQPSFREARIHSTDPLEVLFHTDSQPVGGVVTLQSGLAVNDRVLVMTLNRRVWVIGRKGG